MGGKFSSMDPMEVEVPALNVLMERDSYLRPYEREFRRRYAVFKDYVDRVNSSDGSLDKFTKGYDYFGIHVNPDNSVTAREWAPGAQQVFLTGDFNEWNKESHPYTKLEYGKWEINIPPAADGSCVIKHLSEIKLVIRGPHGEQLFRLSPWAKYVVPPPRSEGFTYKQKFWNPSEKYQFKNAKPKRPKSLSIYECHVGIGKSPKFPTYPLSTKYRPVGGVTYPLGKSRSGSGKAATSPAQQETSFSKPFFHQEPPLQPVLKTAVVSEKLLSEQDYQLQLQSSPSYEPVESTVRCNFPYPSPDPGGTVSSVGSSSSLLGNQQ